jgi:hypothetical protein
MTMIRQSIISLLILTGALLVLITFSFNGLPAISASQPATNPGDDKESVVGQIKELQKQVAELQRQVRDPKTPGIVAAGTATITLPRIQDNKQRILVKLSADIAAQLGGNCIVQLTNRYPTGGSFFVSYWKRAADGFDILVADPSMTSGNYIINDKEPYYIDWIVIQK